MFEHQTGPIRPWHKNPKVWLSLLILAIVVFELLFGLQLHEHSHGWTRMKIVTVGLCAAVFGVGVFRIFRRL